ncbi:MAG: hypothetical protein QM323_04170 [Acidobacteriota bacterium]|nr:hypothetical protein [Acidobacteriota bacterium]
MNDPYFTAAELRAAYPELANAQKYTDVKLELARVFAEQWFEAAAHVAYVRRTATETLSGTGSQLLFLSRWAEVGRPTEVKVGGVPLAPDELADVTAHRYGVLARATRWPAGAEVEVTYPHGYDGLHGAPFGDLVKGAVMMLAVEHAKPSAIPARATSLSTDLGSYRISQADATGKTGIPDVDAVIGLLGADKPATGAGG